MVPSQALVDPFNELANSEENKSLLRKQDFRLIPLCALMYLLAYLDRTNIGNARVMNQETHDDLMSSTGMSSYQYTIALMVFLIAYTVFEVPSNYFLKLMGPSKWFALIMVLWGAVSMGIGGVTNFAGLTALRFILGMFEAGLAPGLAYYISFWYRSDERSIRLAFVYSTATLAGAFGGLIAYGISHMNQTAGLEAWRWLFILEGLPSILAGVMIFFVLPDYPEGTSFLTPEESKLATARMEFNGSKGKAATMTWADAKETLTDLRLYAHYIIYFTKSCPFSSLGLFAPSITRGLGYDSFQAQLMTVPPCKHTPLLSFTFSANNFKRCSSFRSYSHRLLVVRQEQQARNFHHFPHARRLHRFHRLRNPPRRRIHPSLRLPNHRLLRYLCHDPYTSRLALRKPPLHICTGSRARSQHLFRCAGSDHGCVDLQVERAEDWVSHWSLGQWWLIASGSYAYHGSCYTVYDSE